MKQYWRPLLRPLLAQVHRLCPASAPLVQTVPREGWGCRLGRNISAPLPWYTFTGFRQRSALERYFSPWDLAARRLALLTRMQAHNTQFYSFFITSELYAHGGRRETSIEILQKSHTKFSRFGSPPSGCKESSVMPIRPATLMSSTRKLAKPSKTSSDQRLLLFGSVLS